MVKGRLVHKVQLCQKGWNGLMVDVGLMARECGTVHVDPRVSEPSAWIIQAGKLVNM